MSTHVYLLMSTNSWLLPHVYWLIFKDMSTDLCLLSHVHCLMSVTSCLLSRVYWLTSIDSCLLFHVYRLTSDMPDSVDSCLSANFTDLYVMNHSHWHATLSNLECRLIRHPWLGSTLTTGCCHASLQAIVPKTHVHFQPAEQYAHSFELRLWKAALVKLWDSFTQTDGLTGHACEWVIPKLPIQVVSIDDFMHLDALLLLLMVCCVFRTYDSSCNYKVTNRKSAM